MIVDKNNMATKSKLFGWLDESGHHALAERFYLDGQCKQPLVETQIQV